MWISLEVVISVIYSKEMILMYISKTNEFNLVIRWFHDLTKANLGLDSFDYLSVSVVFWYIQLWSVAITKSNIFQGVNNLKLTTLLHLNYT